MAVDQLGLLSSEQWHAKLSGYWKPGEAGAISSLDSFLDTAVENYGTDRDVPGVDGISRLSPHLHFGEISPHQVWNAVQLQAELLMADGNKAAMSNCRDYLKQLVWRDFAHHILFHYPHTQQQAFNTRFDSFPWDDNQVFLEAWQQGRTGIPLVDAGMRELWETGWMHNRVRMIAASLLTKNGLVHWLEGARWFWDTLVDANLANNSMGWQWVAGCGVDAAPYFRIFSPSRQGERFDPYGEYVKRWIPELAGLDAKHIHHPSGAPNSVLSAAGVRLDDSYPRAIVDLSVSRKTALDRYKNLAS